MKWHNQRKIDRIALPITRACNRRCPECMAVERPEIYGKAEPKPHVSIDELRWVGKTLGPIGKIEVTGGEPSMHPEFETISKNIHHWFQCKDIMLLTNGWLFKDESKLPLLLHWDRVYITHYNPEFAKLYGVKTNTDLVDRLKGFLAKHPKVKFWPQEMNRHNSKSAKIDPSKVSCFYYTCDSVGYHQGQIYGCCTAWQLNDRGRGIVLTNNWRNELPEINLPCETCFLCNT